MKRAARWSLLVAALCCGASHARAHAPLPRALAVAPGDAAGIAVRMPGFGWLLHAPGAGDGAFAYACDALLGVSPLEEHVPMAYRSDGMLIAGTAHGIRFLSADGCPTPATPLRGHSISALALQPRTEAADRVYAISANTDAAPIAQRSDDGGEHWTAGAALDRLPVTALVVDAGDPDTLYVSQATSADDAVIAVSRDGGASFATVGQQRALTLLHAHAESARFWATARVATSGVGVDILRAESVQGPWTVALTVNFFGGFAVDPNDADVIWIGDEARGVYRSNDGGDSFDKTQPDVAAACLAYADGALWACTPGLPQRTALARSTDAVTAFEPIMAFADVQHLVECSPEAAVQDRCAAAWVEWQRDVLMTPPMQAPPVIAMPDAGMDEASEPHADADADADADAATALDRAPVTDHAASSPGCGVAMPQDAAPGRPYAWQACVLLAFVFLAQRSSRRRRALDTAAWFCDGQVSHRMQSDLELMQRAATGDPDAFAAIYDRHAAALLALAQRMLRRSDEALDLLHDVFLEAWQHVREYDPARATPRTWLIVRLRSRALDRIAHAARGTRVARALDALPELAPASAPHAETDGEQRELTRSISELDCDLRRVLELTYFEGLTAVEISERDGTPVGTVRSRLARGLAQLRGLLAHATEQSDG